MKSLCEEIEKSCSNCWDKNTSECPNQRECRKIKYIVHEYFRDREEEKRKEIEKYRLQT